MAQSTFEFPQCKLTKVSIFSDRNQTDFTFIKIESVWFISRNFDQNRTFSSVWKSYSDNHYFSKNISCAYRNFQKIEISIEWLLNMLLSLKKVLKPQVQKIMQIWPFVGFRFSMSSELGEISNDWWMLTSITALFTCCISYDNAFTCAKIWKQNNDIRWLARFCPQTWHRQFVTWFCGHIFYLSRHLHPIRCSSFTVTI